MRSFINLVALSGVLLLSGCSIVGFGGDDYIVSGEIGFMRLAPDGDIGLSNTSVTSKNSLEDLGLDDEETTPYAKVNVRLGSNHFTLSGFQEEFKGNGTATATFGNIIAGSPVSSSMDIKNLKLLYRWYIVDLPNVSVGPGIGIDYYDLDAKAVSTGGAISEEFSAKAPLPVIGVSGEVRFGWLRGFADLYGISANVDDFDGTLYDIEAGIKVTPFSMVEATLGYRRISFDGSGKDGGQNYDVDFTLPGFFASIGIRF